MLDPHLQPSPASSPNPNPNPNPNFLLTLTLYPYPFFYQLPTTNYLLPRSQLIFDRPKMTILAAVKTLLLLGLILAPKLHFDGGSAQTAKLLLCDE